MLGSIWWDGYIYLWGCKILKYFCKNLVVDIKFKYVDKFKIII